jgi:hypothetical protein
MLESDNYTFLEALAFYLLMLSALVGSITIIPLLFSVPVIADKNAKLFFPRLVFPLFLGSIGSLGLTFLFLYLGHEFLSAVWIIFPAYILGALLGVLIGLRFANRLSQ